MSQDLDDLIGDWQCPAGGIGARTIPGRDGAELVQLRVDLGVLQMFPDGRPDGTRHRGFASALEFIQHESQARRGVSDSDWQELARELGQLNYRRVAYAALAEEARGRDDRDATRAHLTRAIRDIELGLTAIALLKAGPRPSGEIERLGPVLVFQRARLSSQLRVATGEYEEAVEAAEGGALVLEQLLIERGADSEQREQDAGIAYLRDLGRRLRGEYGIEMTLRERLAAAITAEDFEAAAQLRDELRRRQEQQSSGER